MVWNSRYLENPVHGDRKQRIGLAGCSVREDQAAQRHRRIILFVLYLKR
jgi:hypothetical protein